MQAAFLAFQYSADNHQFGIAAFVNQDGADALLPQFAESRQLLRRRLAAHRQRHDFAHFGGERCDFAVERHAHAGTRISAEQADFVFDFRILA